MPTRLRSDLSAAGMLGHLVLWGVLALVTFGFALFLFPYDFGAKLANSTSLVDERGRVTGRLRCTAPLVSRVGHAFVWWLFTLVTLGLAGFFYLYSVGRTLVDSTVVEPL